jgi:Tfp pilus assembly protein FimT
MKKNGFTLIELLIANMQLAKMGAVKDNADWAVVFDTTAGAHRYLICSDKGADGSWSNTADNTTEKTIILSDYESGVDYGHGNATTPVGTTFGDEITFNANTAVFNSRGMINSITGGYVYLQNNRNNTYAVGALGTGVILMRTWTGTAWE